MTGTLLYGGVAGGVAGGKGSQGQGYSTGTCENLLIPIRYAK
jgi:hypothetical protein